MARIIDARVQQKADTLDNLQKNNLPLLDGEQVFVRSDVDNQVIGYKVATKGKKFRELPYPDYSARGKVSPTSVWTGRQSGVYIPTKNGTYNGVSVNLSDGYQVLYWDGSTIEKVVYPSDFSGLVFGGIIDDSFDLSNPTDPIWYIASAGTYNTSPETVLTQDSILAWDGTSWSSKPFELEVRGEFLVADNMDELRSITSEVASLLVNGTYKAVELLGYYTPGDTPASIKYYVSDTTSPDDGGSVISVVGIKLEHEFNGEVDVSYFGLKQDGVYNNTDSLQKCANLKLPIVVRNTSNEEYMFDGRVRLYSSIRGVGFPVFKTSQNVNTFTQPANYKYWRYSILHVHNKVDDELLTIQGIYFDGSWNGTSTVSEHEAPVVITSSKNVNVVYNKIKNTLGDGVQVYWYEGDYEPRLLDYCENIKVTDNDIINPYRCGVAIISGKNVVIDNNYIYKPYDYVVAIDLEMDLWDKDGQLMQDVYVNNNRVVAPNSENAVSCLGVRNGVNNLVITNNNLECNPTTGRAVNLDAGYGHIKNVLLDNNKVSCALALRITGEQRCSNIRMYNTKPIGNSEYVLANVGWADDVILESNFAKTSLANQPVLIVGGNSTKRVVAKNNILESTNYYGILLVAQNDTVLLSGNYVKSKNSAIRAEAYGTNHYCKNISILSNVFSVTSENQVALSVQTSIENLYIDNSNLMTGYIGLLSNPELVKHASAFDNSNPPYYSYEGNLMFNRDFKRVKVYRNGAFEELIPPATITDVGVVNQGVHVPNGSSVDTLLSSLRAAGIIASS